MVEILNYRTRCRQADAFEYRLESVLGSAFRHNYLAYDTTCSSRYDQGVPAVELAVRAPDGCIVPVSTGTEYNYHGAWTAFCRKRAC